MNEERQQPDPVPGSGAGDAAASQAIPRLPKPVKKSTPRKPQVKKTAAKAPVDAESLDEPKTVVDATTPEADTTTSVETDKGRKREPVAGKEEPEQVKPEPSRPIDPVPTGRTLTAADYARTTKPSPSTTSVIPAVKEEPVDEPAIPPSPVAQSSGSGRQASLHLNHVEPWSVARIAFAISVAMMIVGVVAMTIFWVVLNVTGVWDQVNDAVTSVLSDDSSSFNITDYLGFWRLIGLTLVLSAINVVMMTALATIGAHLYNLAAQVLGGAEVTFGEES